MGKKVVIIGAGVFWLECWNICIAGWIFSRKYTKKTKCPVVSVQGGTGKDII